ncbi:MAG TPA: hypothetical protein VFA56_03040 [Gaiellaceae bacterium]|nr:hypothetical protein [Gaiellaceae bacterium]
MRKLLLLVVPVAGALGGVTFAAAAGGHAAPKPTLTEAVASTAGASSERYTIDVRMTREHTPFTLHIRGQASRETVSVKLRLGSLRLDDGTVVPGPSGATLLDRSFLYERAPSGLAVGKVRWLRLSVAALGPGSDDLRAVRATTPAPLLRLLRAAQIAPAREGARAYHGTVAYDDPAMHALSKLTGDTEFRHLRVSALVGADGFVHRIVLTGRTADGSTSFSLRARLLGFGEPVHTTPPAPGTFVDPALAQTVS